MESWNLVKIAAINCLLAAWWHITITWTKTCTDILDPWETNFSENKMKNNSSSYKKINLKMLLAKWCSFGSGLHVLNSINSLAPGKFEWNFRHVIFKQILVIDDWGISCEIALSWKPHDLTDDKSTLVQVMAWCRQATSHYLSQCWPRSLSPYGVTRPQWVDPGHEAWNSSQRIYTTSGSIHAYNHSQEMK